MDNYVKKLIEMWDKEKYPPDLYDAFIFHDDWCGIYYGTPCNCDPDIEIKKRISRVRT